MHDISVAFREYSIAMLNYRRAVGFWFLSLQALALWGGTAAPVRFCQTLRLCLHMTFATGKLSLQPQVSWRHFLTAIVCKPLTHLGSWMDSRLSCLVMMKPLEMENPCWEN